MSDWANELDRERFHNAVLFCALFTLVDAIEQNSGAEPSKSAYDMALDAAKEVCCYGRSAPSTPDTLGETKP